MKRATGLLLSLILSAPNSEADTRYLVADIAAPPQVTSDATGSGVFVMDTTLNTLSFDIAYEGLAGVEFASHFHGQAGGSVIVHGLPPTNPKVGVYNYPEAAEQELLAGNFYVNIHTDLFPGGEIRGNLVEVVSGGIDRICIGSSCPCGNDDPLAGCANSTGMGTRLTAAGTTSTLHDHLNLTVSGLPPGALGILFMGGPAGPLPFGDGLRCVGRSPMGIYRFPAQVADGAGSFSQGSGIAGFSAAHFPALGHIHAGDSWLFQAWYLDPGGPCGSGFNVSDALRVLFTL